MGFNYEVRFYYKGKKVESFRYMTYDKACTHRLTPHGKQFDKRIIYPLTWIARQEMQYRQEKQEK